MTWLTAVGQAKMPGLTGLEVDHSLYMKLAEMVAHLKTSILVLINQEIQRGIEHFRNCQTIGVKYLKHVKYLNVNC